MLGGPGKSLVRRQQPLVWRGNHEVSGEEHSRQSAQQHKCFETGGCGVRLRGSKEVGVAGAERIRVILVGGGGQRECGGQIM